MSDYSNLLRQIAEMQQAHAAAAAGGSNALAQMRADRDNAKAELARLKAAVTADIQTNPT